MLLFILSDSKGNVIAAFDSRLYFVFSKFMHRQYISCSPVSRGLHLYISDRSEDFYDSLLLSDEYNGIFNRKSNLCGVVHCHWLAYIVPFIYKPSKFNLL